MDNPSHHIPSDTLQRQQREPYRKSFTALVLSVPNTLLLTSFHKQESSCKASSCIILDLCKNSAKWIIHLCLLLAVRSSLKSLCNEEKDAPCPLHLPDKSAAHVPDSLCRTKSLPQPLWTLSISLCIGRSDLIPFIPAITCLSTHCDSMCISHADPTASEHCQKHQCFFLSYISEQIFQNAPGAWHACDEGRVSQIIILTHTISTSVRQMKEASIWKILWELKNKVCLQFVAFSTINWRKAHYMMIDGKLFSWDFSTDSWSNQGNSEINILCGCSLCIICFFVLFVSCLPE